LRLAAVEKFALPNGRLAAPVGFEEDADLTDSTTSRFNTLCKSWLTASPFFIAVILAPLPHAVSERENRERKQLVKWHRWEP
jgi:hypothetical protein